MSASRHISLFSGSLFQVLYRMALGYAYPAYECFKAVEMNKPEIEQLRFWWSIATVLRPLAARIELPFLLLMRAFMGVGEGVAMAAMNSIISKWVPVSERSRSLALVNSGMYLGSVTGLAFSPVLIHNFGWSSVFYAFGSLGSIWFALWQIRVSSYGIAR